MFRACFGGLQFVLVRGLEMWFWFGVRATASASCRVQGKGRAESKSMPRVWQPHTLSTPTLQ